MWWFLILGGLTLLFFQGFHGEFHAWYSATVHPLPRQEIWVWLCYACFPIHIFEAVYVYRLAHRLGLVKSAWGWTFQTFLLGYPSTHLIRLRAKAAGATGGA